MIYHKNKEYPPAPPEPRPTDDGHPREGSGWN